MKIVLSKTCFQRGFELLQNISFIKKNVEEASKTKISQENLTKFQKALLHDIRELHFGIWY